MKRVLLIRLDKIGDLISTMCVDQADFLKDCEVRWVISQGLAFIPENADPKRTFVELSKDNWRISLQKLRLFIREFQPEIAVSFQAPWWVHYALWIEGIPTRAGVQSQWHSFIFLNKGLRQGRSRAIQHEADYNFELLRYAFKQPANSQAVTPVMKLLAKSNSSLLDQYGLRANSYVVVHAGMAGSALNWPAKYYIELIEQLMSKGVKVALTGTPADESFLKDIKKYFANDLGALESKDSKTESLIVNLQNLLTATELFTVLKNSKAVVVPSTGVAHMAASLGAQVMGLYSPVRVQHPRRWAARGEKVRIFVSANETPPYVNVMEDIKVSDVLKEILKQDQ